MSTVVPPDCRWSGCAAPATAGVWCLPHHRLSVLNAEVAATQRPMGRPPRTGRPRQQRLAVTEPTAGDYAPADDAPDRTDAPERARRRRSVERTTRLSDGTEVTEADLTAHTSARDEQGRIVCGGCGDYLDARYLSCGCDPGMVDDDGVPEDPRYHHLGVIAV